MLRIDQAGISPDAKVVILRAYDGYSTSFPFDYIMNNDIIMAYTHLSKPDYTLIIVKPRSVALKTWFTLKNEMFLVYIVSVGIIILVVLQLSRVLVKSIRDADEKRVALQLFLIF